MRIIFLNCWYAKAGKDFFRFIERESLTTEAFFLNEVDPKLFSRLSKILPDFQGFYEKSKLDKVMHFVYGQAAFFKKGIKANCLEKFNLFRNVYNDFGYATPFKLKINRKILFLVNLHGKARPVHKLDTPARIRQSGKIINFFKEKAGAKIIGGDFNLMPNTRSVKLFEKAGYKNLIKDFGIKDTRGELNHRQFRKEEIQYFADYVFVSPEVKIKSFSVPNVEISDHLPLILDFEV